MNDIAMFASVGISVPNTSEKNLPQSCCMTLSTLQRLVLRSEEEIK
jgi:hypothetical protein